MDVLKIQVGGEVSRHISTVISISRFLLFMCISVLLSCDGPNSEVETDGVNRGVHNQDGFRVVLKVNNGASITPDLAVAIQLSAVGADEMYITQESACNIGGTWESFKTFKQWTLQKANGMNFFYIKLRNSNRESDCAFTSIEHDSIAPSVQLTSPLEGTPLLNPSELPLVGTCSEDSTISIKINSVITVSTACLGGTWSKMIDSSLYPAGSFIVEIKAVDQVMNSSSVQIFSFIK